MNRYCEGQRKLVHMDVVKCAEMSNTADGTKSLREPMSTCQKDSKTSSGLLPRLPHKPIKSSSESFQTPVSSVSGVHCDDVDVGQANTDECRQDRLNDADVSDSHHDNVNESARPKCSVEFVSARKYMNPTSTLFDDHVAQSSSTAASPSTHANVTVNKSSRRQNSKHVVTTQTNSLDRYFKPVDGSKTNTASATQSSTTAEQVGAFTTPEKSPRKSVLLSPISKLPGSDTIYYSLSQSSTSTLTSSQDSSSPDNVSKSCKSRLFSASRVDDDDDLDFEAPFDYIWKTNPRTKRKSAKESCHSSKKKSTCTATTACTLQQCNGVSPDVSAESFGLFGFSNNTLIALDNDTDFEEDTVDHFSQLPPEVVSNILCRIPFIDLCLSVNRVCLSWKNIIDSDDVSFAAASFMFVLKFLFN